MVLACGKKALVQETFLVKEVVGRYEKQSTWSVVLPADVTGTAIHQVTLPSVVTWVGLAGVSWRGGE